MIQKLGVYCGSKAGENSELISTIQSLGAFLAEKRISLVYGGGSIGLMGVIADEVLEKGGTVIGVIPRFLDERELGHKGANELILVDSMHERKEKMALLADGFLILPGAIGTMDEFFEILTWKQLGLHNKPIAVFNYKGYYQPLLEQLEIMVKNGFMDRSISKLFVVYEDLVLFEENFLRSNE